MSKERFRARGNTVGRTVIRTARSLRWIVGFGEVAHLSRVSSERVKQRRKVRYIYLGNISVEKTINCMITTLSQDDLKHDRPTSSTPPLTYISSFTPVITIINNNNTVLFNTSPRKVEDNRAFFIYHHLPSLDAFTLPAQQCRKGVRATLRP